jgi:hypothetical protein
MANVVSILKGAKGFDESGLVITAAYAACMASSPNNMSFGGRYIPKAGYSAAGDLTSAEALAMTGNGLAILVVQHWRGGSYVSNAAATTQGTADGNAAVTYASSIGAPAGMFIYCDVEQFDTHAHGALWAAAWAAAVNAATSPYWAAYYGDPITWGLIAGAGSIFHGQWENVNNMGALPAPNISQTGQSAPACISPPFTVDDDTMVTSLGGFWGH